MSLVAFTLTTPADRAVFERISAAQDDVPALFERLRAKKIDVQHETFVYERLQHLEDRLTRHEAIIAAVACQRDVDLTHAVRAQRIYFRALLLALLDAEDAHTRAEAEKVAAKANKETA